MMKKTLITVALCVGLSMSAVEVGFIDSEALRLADRPEIAGGTLLAESKNVKMYFAFDDYVTAKSSSYNGMKSLIVNGEVFNLVEGTYGSTNPSCNLYDGPKAIGCQYHFVVKKNGYLIIPSRLSSNKNFFVYRGTYQTTMTPVAYTLGMEISRENYPDLTSIVYSLPSTADGDFDMTSPEAEKFTLGSSYIQWPIRIATQNFYAESCGDGTGAIIFPVYANAKDYYVFGTGTKMNTCGFIFVESATPSGDPSAMPAVTVYGTKPETGEPAQTKSFAITGELQSPNVLTETMTFTPDNWSNDWTGGPNEYVNTTDGFTLKLEKNGSPTDLVEPDQYSMRIYQGASLTITAPEGAVMKNITFTVAVNSKGYENSHASYSAGWTLTGEVTPTEGSTFGAASDGLSTFTMTAGKQLRIAKIEISYEQARETPLPSDPIEPGDPTKESGIYFGITSFNYLPEIKPINFLTLQNKAEYQQFVNSRTTDDYTYLYYTAEKAVEALKSVTYPVDFTNATLITFTDGNDDGSLEMAPDKSWTDMDYQRYIEQLIQSTKIQGRSLDAYSIGLKGNDIGEYNYDMFKSNLAALASEPKATHATEVGNMNDVEATLNKILDNLETSWLNKKISFNINMRASGDKIRFTLDKTREQMSNNPENSDLWVEGVFSRDDNSLNNITYHGFTSTSGNKVVAKKVEINGRTKYQFTFENLKDLSGNDLETGEINFWHCTEANPVWQPHTEFAQDSDVATETERTSAAIMFVMDCSSSLGDDFAELKRVVLGLIDRLVPGQSSELLDITDTNHHTYPEEYFTLQGVKVTKPSSGIYIRRCGTDVQKVLIR